MAKGDPTTNTNTNTNPQWQQLANSNISYPTSIVPQQMMGQMRPSMGSQFQRPSMLNPFGGGGMGSIGNGVMGGGSQSSPQRPGIYSNPTLNSIVGSGQGQQYAQNPNMNPYQQSFGMGQQFGRTIQPMLQRSMMPMNSMQPQQPTNGMGPNDQQQPQGPQQA